MATRLNDFPLLVLYSYNFFFNVPVGTYVLLKKTFLIIFIFNVHSGMKCYC